MNKKVSRRRSGKSASARRKTKQKKEDPGAWFRKLVALQARLRAPNGCPWDMEQTHSSLRTYLIEEAYEVLEALESGNDSKFAEELGDLLLQVVFHSQIAAETGRFTSAEVIQSVHDKMVRRHPHVFGEKRAKNSKEVLKSWEQIKAEERKQSGQSEKGSVPPSLLDGVTKALPAVLEGFQLTRRASRIGFDWDSIQGVLDKVSEESREIASAPDAARREEEVGDLLFAAVNVARFLHVDPEIALKKANVKFKSRFRRMEQLARASGRELSAVPREEMEAFWEQSKLHDGAKSLKVSHSR